MPAPTRPIDLLDRALYEGDPDPTYAWLREHAPVCWDELNELWGIARHEDVVAVERDPELFCNGEGSRPNIPPDPSMINADDPLHGALRQLFVKRITPRGVKRYERRVREIASELIDAVSDQGACDVVHDIAIPLPVRTIVEALGFPAEDWCDYAHWAEVTMTAGGGPRYLTPEVIEAAGAFFERARITLEARRDKPSDDMISLIVRAADSGPAARDDAALLSESLLLLNGGSDTTRHVIAGGTLALLQHPEQLELLRREPLRLPVAIEEMIRWVTPLLNMRRTATRDTELRGQTIRKGQQLLLMYSSANRDAEVFDQPETFDITRDPNPHIAFGIGTHFCLGANLARLELRTMFGEMLTRLGNLRLADRAEPRVVSTAFARGLANLPVEFDAV